MSLQQFVQKLQYQYPSVLVVPCSLVADYQDDLLSQVWKVALQRDLVQSPNPELELCSKTGTSLWVCVTKLPFGSHAW